MVRVYLKGFLIAAKMGFVHTQIPFGHPPATKFDRYGILYFVQKRIFVLFNFIRSYLRFQSMFRFIEKYTLKKYNMINKIRFVDFETRKLTAADPAPR